MNGRAAAAPLHARAIRFAGLSRKVELKLVSRLEFRSGAVALRYVPRSSQTGVMIGPRVASV